MTRPGALEYSRRWSLFAPAFTYAVRDQGTWIGEVARNANNPHKWWASNKTWSGGADLKRTFRTRWEAATALRHIADGHDPETVGGYATDEPETPDTETKEKAS